MRLTCPNCGAQYEVPSAAIPDEGRDVQCSNCGDTWFQNASRPLSQQDTSPPAPPEVTADVSFEETVDTDDLSSEDGDDIGTPVEPASPRRDIDPAITQLLREEAQRETALRAQSDIPLETQTEMGLAMPQAQPDISRDTDWVNPAPSSEISDAVSTPLETKVSPPRRDFFPDIETVSSSLSESTAGQGTTSNDQDNPSSSKRRGFTPGFAFALATIFIAIVIYANAAALAELLPPFKNSLIHYTSWVDTIRLWLDNKVGSLSNTIEKHEA